MEKVKLKKGDWCFCEFKLQQITNTEENRITEVNDGMFTMSGYDISDRCFPLELEIKRCSDSAKYWSERFYQLNHKGLNHPELNNEIIDIWVAMCQNKNNEEKLQVLYERLNKFGNTVVEKIKEVKYTKVKGISLFRS